MFVDSVNRGDDSLFLECGQAGHAEGSQPREASWREEGRHARFILKIQTNIHSLLRGESTSHVQDGVARGHRDRSARPALQVLSTLTTPRAC